MAANKLVSNSLILCTFCFATAIPVAVAAEKSAEDESAVDDIVVTATRLPRNMMDIAGTVSVITDEQIERQVAADLDDLVRYQPGITMSTHGRGGNMGFVIRGMGGNRVLTMIDGVRSANSYQGGPIAQGIDAFEIDDLKAVEIIRGPASVLYGADAMGGAVILRTRDPVDYLDDDNLYLAVRGGYMGANDETKLGLTGATQVGDLGLFLQYTNRSYEERQIEGDASRNPLDGGSDGLLLKSVWSPNERHRLQVSFDMLREDKDFVLESELSSSVFESLAEDEMERSRVSLHHDWRLGAGIADSIETSMYTQSSDGLQHTEEDRLVYSFFDIMDFATYFGEPGLRVSDFEFNQETSGLGVMLTKTFAVGSTEHALVYGFNYDETETERPRDRYEVLYSTGNTTQDIRLIPGGALLFEEPPIDPTPYFETFPNKSFPDTDTKRTGIYVQDEIAFGTSGFTLIPGFRYDRYEMNADPEGVFDPAEFGFSFSAVSESHTSVNLGVIYDVSDHIALFAQYSEGFRPPNYEEANISYVNHAVGYGIMPNPDVQPETSQGVELGVKASLANSFLSFAIYDNEYEDFIDSQFVGQQGAITLFQEVNIDEVRIYGAEASAVVALADNVEFNASVALARGDDEESDVPLDSVDPLTLVLGMRFSGADNRWSVEPRVTLVDAKDRVSSPDAVTAPGYGIVDLVGSWNITDNARLNVGLFNLMDKEYSRWANIQGYSADDSDALALAREPGFNARANFSIRF